MAANASFVGTIITPVVSLANADGTGFKTFAAAIAAGQRLDVISATNSDAAVTTVLQFAIQVSGVDYVIGEVSVPAGAGTNGTAKAVNVLNDTDMPQFANTIKVAFLSGGAALRVRAKVAVAGGNTIHLVGMGGSY